MTTVRLTEIYASIQGESTRAGLPCVFIRLTGCPLRCAWCDTEYAFTGGETREVEAIVSSAESYGVPLVEVTGGEPLAQPGTPGLLAALADRFPTVLLETSGALPIDNVDPRVTIIMDLKAPGSGEESRNHWPNLTSLKPADELKLVLADRADYVWARGIIEERSLPREVPVLLSPVHGTLSPRRLAQWIVEDALPVRLQLQQHKYIWDPTARGV